MLKSWSSHLTSIFASLFIGYRCCSMIMFINVTCCSSQDRYNFTFQEMFNISLSAPRYMMGTNLLHFTAVYAAVLFVFSIIFHFLMRQPECPALKMGPFQSLTSSLYTTFQLGLGHGEVDVYSLNTPVMVRTIRWRTEWDHIFFIVFMSKHMRVTLEYSKCAFSLNIAMIWFDFNWVDLGVLFNDISKIIIMLQKVFCNILFFPRDFWVGFSPESLTMARVLDVWRCHLV